MSFRQFGGLNYSARHNTVSSNSNKSNNLIVKQNAGISDNLKISNNLEVLGNTDICGNLTAYNMFLSSGIFFSTQSNAVVTKSYVDTYATGLNIQGSVITISTDGTQSYTTAYPVPIYPDNVTIPFTINGVTFDNNENLGKAVLLNDQGDDQSGPDNINNGVYVFSYDNNDGNYYFIRSTTQVTSGSNSTGVYIQSLVGIFQPNSGWVQYKNPGIVGSDKLFFYPFNPSSGGSTSYTPNIGLYTTVVGSATNLNVDSSLNFLTGIDASGGETLDVATQSSILNLGSTDTSVNIVGNPYIFTPYSIGSTFSPRVVNITSSSNSTQITFIWTPPAQNTSISSSIQDINATLYANISESIKTYPIITSSTSAGIDINTLSSIVITNQSTAITGQNENTFTYYNSEFTNMLDSSYNQLILWYTNYSPYPNVSYAGYTSFQSINPPSIVLFNYNNSATINTPATVDENFNVTNGTVTLQCYVEYVDSINLQVDGPPYVSNYQILNNNYSSDGSTSRYNSAISDTGTSTLTSQTVSTNANINTQFTISDMYPDSNYNFKVQAKNSSSGYGDNGTYNYLTPVPHYPNATFSTPSFLFNADNYKYPKTIYFLVSDNSSITDDIINYNNITQGFVSNNIITAVQQNGTYGTNSTSSTLIVTASLNSTTTSTTVKSFGFGPNFTSSSGGITVTSKTFDAYYKGESYNQGFYLDCSTNMTISDNYDFGLPTSSQFTATLTVTGNNINPISSYNFYIDNINSTPTLNNQGTFTLNSINNHYSNQVSGIWVLNQSQSPVFSVTNLQLSNMGDYFYSSPLITYVISNGVTGNITETNTANVTNTTGSKFQNPINITNNNLNPTTVSLSYSKSISTTIQFNNLFSQGSGTLPIINVICDQPSYNLIKNVLAQTINNLSTSGTSGYRVWSANVDSSIPGGGTMNPSAIVPYPYVVSGTSIPTNTATLITTASSDKGYVDIQYDNIWDILGNTVANQELLVASGNFTTSSSFYLNYSLSSVSSANLNTVNYTGLASTGNSGIKFATFAWNLNQSTTYTNANYMNFVLNLTSNIYFQSTSNTWFFDNNFTKPLYLFYRFEYTNNVSSPTFWGQTGGNYYPNTTWISINTSTTDTGINTINICNSNNIKDVYYNPPDSSSSSSQVVGSITFKAARPTVNIIDYPATLYLRIGIPNGYNGFNSISCYFSGS